MEEEGTCEKAGVEDKAKRMAKRIAIEFKGEIDDKEKDRKSSNTKFFLLFISILSMPPGWGRFENLLEKPEKGRLWIPIMGCLTGCF